MWDFHFQQCVLYTILRIEMIGIFSTVFSAFEVFFTAVKIRIVWCSYCSYVVWAEFAVGFSWDGSSTTTRASGEMDTFLCQGHEMTLRLLVLLRRFLQIPRYDTSATHWHDDFTLNHHNYFAQQSSINWETFLCCLILSSQLKWTTHLYYYYFF